MKESGWWGDGGYWGDGGRGGGRGCLSPRGGGGARVEGADGARWRWVGLLSHPGGPPLDVSRPTAWGTTSASGGFRPLLPPLHLPTHETSPGTAGTRRALAGEARAGPAGGRGAPPAHRSVPRRGSRPVAVGGPGGPAGVWPCQAPRIAGVCLNSPSR